MAKLTVVREKPVTPPPCKITLELTEDEAQYLRDLLGSGIVGVGMYRRINDSIWHTLKLEFEQKVYFSDAVAVDKYDVKRGC